MIYVQGAPRSHGHPNSFRNAIQAMQIKNGGSHVGSSHGEFLPFRPTPDSFRFEQFCWFETSGFVSNSSSERLELQILKKVTLGTSKDFRRIQREPSHT